MKFVQRLEQKMKDWSKANLAGDDKALKLIEKGFREDPVGTIEGLLNAALKATAKAPAKTKEKDPK